MNDCIFCKIINGDIPSATIYENEEFKVILDRFPANEGHVLILPKEHSANIFEINPEQAGRLFVLATKIAREMKTILGLEHLNVMQNNGTVAGQTVFHFHLHLIPRYENDGITIAYKPMDLCDAQIEDMRKKLEMSI
ncbi:HIT family protein [Anaerotignum sp. MB30-C6]|uniref:HIT family protein n=1 Tax=Anaerotignum sp. MB30-C6 TaxID=3070814 RepID=UPI0027DAB921|nr:HIT family protein [Anaerotignum sp. MB30-C6]WMI81446.1 HIT family protein [Anaerotignum sp. MB30-C6]